MMKRIFAWVILAMFVLLLLNILVFRIYMVESMYLYGVIIALFFITRALKPKESNNNPPTEGEGGMDDGEGEEKREEAGDEQSGEGDGNDAR